MKIINNSIYRQCVFTLGVVSAGLGIVGVFLPILPTTPFMLLAAWCFVRSSEKAHQWLYRQPLIGEALRDWDRNKAISRKAKVMAVSMMTVSLIVMWMKVTIVPLKIAVTAILVSVGLFLVSRPEK